MSAHFAFWHKAEAGSRPVGRKLTRSFYARDALTVARELLGLHLVRTLPSSSGFVRQVGRIVETEAYMGPDDLAAHSAGGRRTPRTETMFGPPGREQAFGQHQQRCRVGLLLRPEPGQFVAGFVQVAAQAPDPGPGAPGLMADACHLRLQGTDVDQRDAALHQVPQRLAVLRDRGDGGQQRQVAPVSAAGHV